MVSVPSGDAARAGIVGVVIKHTSARAVIESQR
jgi:hypothetical protein